MRKEYMGEMTVPLLDWFEGGDVKLWNEDLTVRRSDIHESPLIGVAIEAKVTVYAPQT
jgi:hypothetical protein